MYICTATVILPLSIHAAMLGVFMFLNGIATGGLDNGMYSCYFCFHQQGFISKNEQGGQNNSYEKHGGAKGVRAIPSEIVSGVSSDSVVVLI